MEMFLWLNSHCILTKSPLRYVRRYVVFTTIMGIAFITPVYSSLTAVYPSIYGVAIRMSILIEAPDSCACDIMITLDRPVPGIVDLIADEVFQGVNEIADYAVRADPTQLIGVYYVQVYELMDKRQWDDEAFLDDVAKIIDKNRSRLVKS